jgi:hypothetical protein
MPLGSCRHKIDPYAPAFRAHKASMPVGNSHLGGVALGHLAGVGLDLAPAVATPDDQLDSGRRGVAKGHGRALVGLHPRRRRLPPRMAHRTPATAALIRTAVVAD